MYTKFLILWVLFIIYVMRAAFRSPCPIHLIMTALQAAYALQYSPCTRPLGGVDAAFSMICIIGKSRTLSNDLLYKGFTSSSALSVGGKCGSNYSESKRYFYFQVLLSSEMTKS